MKIIVSAGGTGGHLYPALALVEYIQSRNPDTEFLFVGTTDRIESRIVPEKGYNYVGLHVKGMVGNPIQKAKNALIFLKSLSHSKKIIRNFDPDVIIGFGGYPSASIVLAGQQLHKKTMIHEQNSVIGLTNKILVKKVDKIIACYEKAYNEFPKEKTYLLGNPRASVIAQSELKDVHDLYHIEKDRKVLVIVMGSLGSSSVNNVMMEALKQLDLKDTDVLFTTGNQDYERIKSQMQDVSENIHVLPYIDDMPSVLSTSTLVVSRGGATTLAEITSIGAASVIIPSPYVVANHQEYNARELSDKKAAYLLLEKDLTAEHFVSVVSELLNDPDKINELKTNAKLLGKPDACKDIYEQMVKLINE